MPASLCMPAHGAILTPCVGACSPSEAWDAFVRARVGHSVWQQDAPALIASPELMCRIGGSIYPWKEAAAHLVGTLAFGPMLQGECLGKGVPVAMSLRKDSSAPVSASSKVCPSRIHM